jgi:AmmeMemoRadiSam system protein B/AmmeMemoRadiSam system protein A
VLLADATAARQAPFATTPKAIIVPHAGYIYSGATAALAYAELSAARKTIRRVVLLGPVHRVPVRGLALPDVDRFATPLGDIPLDHAAIARICHLRQVVDSAPAHAHEHALEVQLPFLQAVLDDFTLVPLAVGDASAADVAQVLELLWGGPETLIVISSDLSHFLPYPAAQQIDRATVQDILALTPTITHAQACGGTPLNGLLLAARRHGLQPRLLGQCNSGDTAGDKQRVVGYAAFAFTQAQTDERGPTLLAIARAAIAQALGRSAAMPADALWLQAPGATFVTLTQLGRLRGCIGSLQAQRPLLDDVRANAVAAALRDPRFAPLAMHELDAVRMGVSLLSPIVPMPVIDQADALAQLRVGVDGLVFECQGRRSTFLPQVWEQLPTAQDFLDQLKVKAGFAANFWAADIQLHRYTVAKWEEPEEGDDAASHAMKQGDPNR